MAQQFKVEGIPKKFINDSNGLIRFKFFGYNSSEDAIMAEPDAMIELASISTAKAI